MLDLQDLHSLRRGEQMISILAESCQCSQRHCTSDKSLKLIQGVHVKYRNLNAIITDSSTLLQGERLNS